MTSWQGLQNNLPLLSYPTVCMSEFRVSQLESNTLSLSMTELSFGFPCLMLRWQLIRFCKHFGKERNHGGLLGSPLYPWAPDGCQLSNSCGFFSFYSSAGPATHPYPIPQTLFLGANPVKVRHRSQWWSNPVESTYSFGKVAGSLALTSPGPTPN